MKNHHPPSTPLLSQSRRRPPLPTQDLCLTVTREGALSFQQPLSSPRLPVALDTASFGIGVTQLCGGVLLH